MTHLCLCPNNSCRSSRVRSAKRCRQFAKRIGLRSPPHPAHLPNRILPTPRSFAVAPGAMLAFSEQAKSPITRPWPSWATHLEVTDLKMEESWLNHAFERRLGEAIAKPPKARTVARLCRAGFEGAKPLVPFLSPFLCGTTKKWHSARPPRCGGQTNR